VRFTSIGRRRRSGKLNRRAHDRHDDDAGPAVTDVRFPWHRDVQRFTGLTVNDSIIAVMRRSWKEGFGETSSHFLGHL
jgi:hypothetical protein